MIAEADDTRIEGNMPYAVTVAERSHIESGLFVSRATMRAGDRVVGKYRVQGVLGTGGMATVYAATHRNGLQVAIKVLHAALASQPGFVRRFLAEGTAANAIPHRGVVKVLDEDVTEDGVPFLVMERLEGQTAEELSVAGSVQLGVHVSVAILDQALDALASAHGAGVLHRDVKPPNLFVTVDGEVKLLDFGIATTPASNDGPPSEARRGVIVGTPDYMPPEQAVPGMDEVDERSDVWAAGATLFTLLSGRSIRDGETTAERVARAACERVPPLADVCPDLPVAVREVVDIALSFEKDKRWQSAAQMRQALLAAYRLHFGRAPTRDVLVRLGATEDTLPVFDRRYRRP